MLLIGRAISSKTRVPKLFSTVEVGVRVGVSDVISEVGLQQNQSVTVAKAGSWDFIAISSQLWAVSFGSNRL